MAPIPIPISIIRRPRRGPTPDPVLRLKRRPWTVLALGALIAIGGGALGAQIARADLTGDVELDAGFLAIPCQLAPLLLGGDGNLSACEATVVTVDLETALSFDYLTSGLGVGLHGHLGATGLEDVVLRFETTLGSLELLNESIFAQAFGLVPLVFGTFAPACYEGTPGSGRCATLFRAQRLTAEAVVGGVTLSALTLVEDLAFPDPGELKPPGAVYTTQSQSFGFGSVLQVQGETPSGIVLGLEAGLCARRSSMRTKRHVFPFSLDPDCFVAPQTPSEKPPLFFSYERILVEGIPLVQGVGQDVEVVCEGVLRCEFTSRFRLEAVSVFSAVQAALRFETISGPFSFSGISLQLQAVPLTIVLAVDEAFLVSTVNVVGGVVVNPEARPAFLSGVLLWTRATGLQTLSLTLLVPRASTTASVTASFAGSAGSFALDSLRLQGAVRLRPEVRLGAFLTLSGATGLVELGLSGRFAF